MKNRLLKVSAVSALMLSTIVTIEAREQVMTNIIFKRGEDVIGTYERIVVEDPTNIF